MEGGEQQKTTSRDLVSFALVKELTVVASYCYHDALSDRVQPLLIYFRDGDRNGYLLSTGSRHDLARLPTLSDNQMRQQSPTDHN